MPFSPKHLSVLAYVNGFTLWHYRSAIDAEDCEKTSSEFFADADAMRDGDLVICVLDRGDGKVAIWLVIDRTDDQPLKAFAMSSTTQDLA